MRATGTSVVCERVRAQVSLHLDGELSELERRMLAAHLQRCAECRAFAVRITDLTFTLREAPLEKLERSVEVLRPRRRPVARLNVGIAAAVAIVAVGIAAQLAPVRPESLAVTDSRAAVTQFQTRLELEQELAIIELVRTRTATSASVYML